MIDDACIIRLRVFARSTPVPLRDLSAALGLTDPDSVRVAGLIAPSLASVGTVM